MNHKTSNRTEHTKKHNFIKENYILIGILLLAACARLIGLDSLPDGVLPDEAYGAYNAYSLMREGIDSRGYTYPVYFVAWGSGMSVLYSYLAVPLMRLFGTAIAVYRIPQAAVGIASVYAMYHLGKDLFDKKMGYLLAFVLAINPWHIMNTRFGLDANMAPGLFVIALCFLVKGVKRNHKYLILAAVFLGGVLYCYALSWIMVPVFLVLALIVYYKRIPRTWYTVLFVALLFGMALPLLLFVGINLRLLPEIRTEFFSIPKLPGFRGEELDMTHILDGMKALGGILLHQYDGVEYTASKMVGAYYLFTTPFMIIGIIAHVISFVKGRKECKKGECELHFVFLIWLLSAFLMSILNENITIIHVNLIHIPLIFYGAYGIWQLAEWWKNKMILPVCIAFWCVSFVMFYYQYATEPTTYFFDERADEIIEVAKEAAGDGMVTLVGYTTIKYSNLFWHEKPSAAHYSANVVYTGLPAWAEMESYGQFRYINTTEEAVEPGVYIIPVEPRGYEEDLRHKGFDIQSVNDRFSLAIKK